MNSVSHHVEALRKAISAEVTETIAAWLEIQRNDIPAQGAEFAAALRTCGPLQPAPAALRLDDIEQYRMQMAGISTAAFGYWKEGDGIHPDYDTLALRDVAKLYAKYDALYKAAQPIPDARLDELRQANGGALNYVTLREFRAVARAVEQELASRCASQPTDEDIYAALMRVDPKAKRLPSGMLAFAREVLALRV